MKTLLDANSLCSSILRLNQVESGAENMSPNNTMKCKQIFNDIPFPIYQKSDMATIINSLSANMSFIKVLSSHDYCFPFKPDLVSQLLTNRTISKSNPQYAINFLMNSYLSWSVLHYKRNMTEHLPQLIQAIGSLATIEYVYRNKKLQSTILSAYVHLYLTFVKDANDAEFSQFQILLNELFLNDVQVPSDVYTILIKTANRIIDQKENNLNKESVEFITFLDGLVLKNPDAFPSEVAKAIIQMLCSSLSGLDISALGFLSHVTKILDEKFLLSIISIFPAAIISNISKNEPINKFIENEDEYIELPESASFISSLSIIRYRTFDGEIDLTNKIIFPERLPLTDFISENITTKINMIACSIKGNKQLCSKIMYLCPKIIENMENSPYLYDTLTAFFYLFGQILLETNLIPPLDILCNNYIFNPSITVFNQHEQNWEQINTLRATAIDLMLCEGIPALQSALYSKMTYPYLFAEMMQRFLLVQPCIQITRNEIVVLSQCFMYTMSYYQKFENLKDNELQAVNTARISIFQFLNNLLVDRTLLNLFFTDPFFIEAYLSLMFEEPVRPIVLAPLLKYLSSNNANNNELVMKIHQIITIISEHFDDVEVIKLASDLLTVITDSIQLNPQLACQYEPILNDLCKGMVNVPKSEPSVKFLVTITTFCTEISNFHQFTSPEVAALETAIRNVHGNEPSQELFIKIVQMIAGTKLPSLHPSFIVQQPKVLRLLIAIFVNSQMLKDVFTFIAQLCQYSEKNCMQAHQGEVDLFIIETLDKWRDDEKVQYTVIAAALSLVMLISSKISSVSIVQHFISLLCPIDSKFLRHYHQLTLKSLNSMLLSAKSRPPVSLPLIHGSFFYINGLKGEQVENGFTVGFWVFNNNNEVTYKPQLLVLTDSKNQKVAFYLVNNSLCIYIEGPSFNYNGKADLKLPEGEWIYISATLHHDPKHDMLNAAATVNGCAMYADVFFPKFRLVPGAITARVGGIMKDSSKPESPSLLGSISLYPPLSMDDIQAIYQMGSQTTTMKNPYFVFRQEEHDGQLVFKNIVDDSINASASIPISHPLPFTDILITKCNSEMLLPIFAQWNLTFKNGEKVPYIVETTFEILENSLLINPEAEQTFLQADGFRILSHLIISSKDENINYPLYTRFFQLFESLQNHDLQIQLFDHILTNIEIWMKCDAENHRRVIRHWARIFAPTYRETFIKYRPFTWITSALRVFYWYNPVEKGLIKCENRCRNQELNVCECRNYLLLIAHIIARNKFTDSDFRMMMSHILTCGDHQQCIDLMLFLKDLIAEQEATLVNVNESMNLISMLQYLFNIRNERVICTTLTIMINAHRANLMKGFDLTNHIDIILHQLTPDFVTKTMLTKLADITEKAAPEMFPICSWMAMNIGNSGMRLMLNKIKPSSKLCTCESWALWAVVALYKADEKLQRFISRYLVKCSSNSINLLFATIDIVGRALGENVENILRIVVIEFGKLLLRDDSNLGLDYVLAYFQLTRHLLFFRMECNNVSLLRLYENSDFSETGKNFPRVKLPIPTSPKSYNSPKKVQKRKSRHSLRPNAILNSMNENRYSPELAEQALSFLNPRKETQQSRSPTSYRNRRTSLMTFAKKSFDYDENNSKPVEHKILSMMPNELDEKISEIANKEINYTFGLRMNRHQRWQDADIATQAIQVFSKMPDTRVAETVLFIAGFLLHENPEPIRPALEKINVHSSQLQNAIFFYDHHAKKTGQPKISHGFDEEIEVNAARYLFGSRLGCDKTTNSAPLSYMKHLIKFQHDNSTTAFDIFAMINDSIISLANNVMADFNDKVNHESGENANLWRQFWHHMTIQRAPWNKSLPSSSIKQLHFKRDDVTCKYFCPMKMKRNFKFDDHLHASMVRDTGSIKSATQHLEQYRAELAEQYKKNAPTGLFEVIEDTNQAKDDKALSISQCIVELPCEIIKVSRVTTASFSLLTDAIVLTHDSKITIIKLADVKNIFYRTRFHHPTALEVFTINGKSYLINFPNIKSIPVLRSFKSLQLPNVEYIQTSEFKPFFNSLKLTDKWINRKCSNFEYLMMLNIMSGRSFNDVSQYPIIPWVLKDYESQDINLDDINIYRDLTKPIGALTPERLIGLHEKFEHFVHLGLPPYLYSSGYSCPLSIYLWLLRMEPFTTQHIDIQSGRFDHAARLFSSISNSFKLSSTHPNDFRELIPEFFYQPDFLMNNNKFDLGNVNGVPVNDVELPPWAKTPYEFVYLNRKALESEYVSRMLHRWIDLIWGDKQNGEKARENDNLYMPQMYTSIWTQQNLQDPGERAQIEAMLCHVGQVPPQLFDKPHPTRSRNANHHSPITRPVSMNMESESILFASIDSTNSQKIKILAISESKKMISSTFSLPQITKHSIKGNLPVRSKSNSVNLTGIPMTKKKADRFSTGDGIIIPPIDVKCTNDTTISRSMSNFNDLYPKDGQKLITASYKNNILIAKGNELHAIKHNGATEMISRQRSEIVSVACENDIIATASKDAVVSVYNNNFKIPQFTFPSFSSSIKCCAISNNFHTLVCGTRDCSLMLCSLSSGAISKVIDLDGKRPISILITPSWGFIVVYLTDLVDGKLKHSISLYSINGDLIRTKAIEYSVQAWCSYSSLDGFDHIIMADDANAFYNFEAFYLNVDQRMYGSNCKIISTSYLSEEDTVVAVTEEGNILFIPNDL